MIVPIFMILITFLFVLMWAWIISIFSENGKIKAKIDELISQPLTVEQKKDLDNLQLDLDTNAFRARQTKRVVLTFSIIYAIAAIALIWINTKYALFTFGGMEYLVKLSMLLIILFFVPAYIGLELISNTQGASDDIANRMKLSEELKPGEEVEV